jgi:hypothetical protein
LVVDLKRAINIFANIPSFMVPIEHRRRNMIAKIPQVSTGEYLEKLIDLIKSRKFKGGDMTFVYLNFSRGRISKDDVHMIQEYVGQYMNGMLDLRVKMVEDSGDFRELLEEAVGIFKSVKVWSVDGTDLNMDGVEMENPGR